MRVTLPAVAVPENSYQKKREGERKEVGEKRSIINILRT